MNYFSTDEWKVFEFLDDALPKEYKKFKFQLEEIFYGEHKKPIEFGYAFIRLIDDMFFSRQTEMAGNICKMTKEYILANRLEFDYALLDALDIYSNIKAVRDLCNFIDESEDIKGCVYIEPHKPPLAYGFENWDKRNNPQAYWDLRMQYSLSNLGSILCNTIAHNVLYQTKTILRMLFRFLTSRFTGKLLPEYDFLKQRLKYYLLGYSVEQKEAKYLDMLELKQMKQVLD